jgi:hypothetical protein
MPKRKIDPTTGEPRLTHREQRLVDEFISNGGNGSRAAASAGYGTARPDQSAYQVLRRPEVQHHIRARIAESRVSADEIIGTLASCMRGRPGEFFDESGEFSITLAKQKGIDHLLKSFSGATRTIEATPDKPAQVVRTYRGTLHSPIQAATALARILGIDGRSSGRRPSHPLATDHRPLTTDFAADFKVTSWLEDLIQQQMREQALSRPAVIEILLRLRPEMARYIQELPDPNQAAADLSLLDLAKQFTVGLDFMASLASDPNSSPHTDPVKEAFHQIETLSQLHTSGALTDQDFNDAIHRITSRLTQEQCEALERRLTLKAGSSTTSTKSTMTRTTTTTSTTTTSPTRPNHTRPNQPWLNQP